MRAKLATPMFRFRWLTELNLVFLVFIFISCNREKSVFETEIVKGYWLNDFTPGTPFNENDCRFCTKFTVDGRSIWHGFNIDGSVDSLHMLRRKRNIEWNYFRKDNIFCVSSSDGYDYFKVLKIVVDTLFLEVDLCQTAPFKKGYIIHLVRYRPRCVTFKVADSNMTKHE